ncbi:toxin glutamine deamidase domain-containing protein [Tessaracoccus sp. HF-7]|nr:toxin glutamine deamidase domain-containing protein [Tessaracoccus caeni]MDF1487704.1 toxin glutamine deamidase domain-containing protein [Tessaracoccus caeni]
MDIEAGRDLAASMSRASSDMSQLRDSLGRALQSSTWVGRDAEQFRSLWNGQLSPKLSSVVTALSEQAELLRRNAQAQEMTSAVLGEASSGVASGGGRGDDEEWYTPKAQSAAWLSELPRVEESREESLKRANPKYRDFSQGLSAAFNAIGLLESSGEWRNNCGYAAIAYDMRRRGFDVEAKPDLNGDTYMNLAAAYADPVSGQPGEWETTGDKTATVDRLTEYGTGARAMVVVEWEGRSGAHAFVAENVNGRIDFLDPQNPAGNADSYFDRAEPGKVMVLRLDDLEPRSNPMKHQMVEENGS